MELQVLGCSGGIGAGNRTTSLRLGENMVIDAGTGLADLSLAELARIDHVFLTHAHLDHIACLPLLLDTVAPVRTTPVTVHASQSALDTLQRHIFNWQVWPDFTQIPHPDRGLLRYEVMERGDTCTLGGLALTALPVLHTVPAVAYHIDSGNASVVFSGDTDDHAPFWQAVSVIDNLQTLIIETAFADHEAALARASRHLTPQRLLAALKALPGGLDIRITHLKPFDHDLIMRELTGQAGPDLQLKRLEQGDVIHF
ncbi:MBL fold metallo-hydrolase [Silvimonas amylolytica]|uniref:cAMP phosphodiesterase class-II:metallo-beta-lactamase superfamily protein n=1 Tax=Silvimonas amylolytica TaxID=449663 RepID=A0ABQ2PTA5_9NEIS|nr:3',5'-cyclic-nucleotide phosphodiesterase [Silvimonas amylolytica]GGP28207.1 cAMP phosphodiesterase class-II:metallo-beta-lactamase superfamily protein [Silvimonas amylolytica]